METFKTILAVFFTLNLALFYGGLLTMIIKRK
jgi:hypothetical protein